ncbi:MAG: tetratricopeptide repeat protein [Bacteroidales bacterium]
MLYREAKYASAITVFDRLSAKTLPDETILSALAELEAARSATELYHNDAAYRLDHFLAQHPGQSFSSEALYLRGLLAYNKKQYRKVVEHLSQVDPHQLSAEEKDEYYFKLGYAKFETGDIDGAKKMFNTISASSSVYSAPAKYYLAHLDYVQGNFDEALLKFEQLEDDPDFGPLVPFYRSYIFYRKGEYEKVRRIVPDLVEQIGGERQKELVLMVADACYMLEKWPEAVKWFERYQELAGITTDRLIRFKAGFSYLKEGKAEQAAELLQGAAAGNDTLAQFAWYWLGDAYLQLDKKAFAADAFHKAYQIPFQGDLREDALFHHARLAFELSFDPYNEAVRALKNYLKAYPDSKRADEAYRFLFDISLATRNFSAALDALENIQVKNTDYKSKFQKVSYYYGIDLFNQGRFEEAGNQFLKAIEWDQDKELTRDATFWLGESFYRQQNWWAAKKYYLEFLGLPGAKHSDYYIMGHYNLGYVYFRKKEYKSAVPMFKKVADQLQGNDLIVADAELRLGDCWFVNKSYEEAVRWYEKAIRTGLVDVDYGVLQAARALGVMLQFDKKIDKLKNFSSRFPDSPYRAEALIELAEAWQNKGDNEEALYNYKLLIKEFPSSPLAVKARLKSGLIYYNSGLNDLALKSFREVVEQFPGSPESIEALASIRNIYVDMGQADKYFEYASGLSFASVSADEQDSLAYTAAENLYMNEQYDRAAGALGNYLTNYPNGAYRVQASWFLADLMMKNDQQDSALQLYYQVIAHPGNAFYPNALFQAAGIELASGHTEEALEHYRSLEKTAGVPVSQSDIRYGIVRSLYLLNRYDELLAPSEKLLKDPKLEESKKLEVMMMRARALESTGELLLAKSLYRDLAGQVQDVTGAEAQYRLAELSFELADYENAEKEAFELINNYGVYDYWVARGFILLADIYDKTGNTFQAKQTLQSIIDNYEGIDLKNFALNKLNAILDREEAAQQPDSLIHNGN